MTNSRGGSSSNNNPSFHDASTVWLAAALSRVALLRPRVGDPYPYPYPPRPPPPLLLLLLCVLWCFQGRAALLLRDDPDLQPETLRDLLDNVTATLDDLNRTLVRPDRSTHPASVRIRDLFTALFPRASL